MNIWLIFLFAFLGCGKDKVQCSEETPCGFGEVCVEGVCEGQSCATNTQCSMESYCLEGSCTEGCLSDEDCYPGDYCELGEQLCQSAPCTNSHVDCGFKEFCNNATGECIDASGYYCRDCITDADCGGNGNVCMHWGLERDFCGVTCEVESDCPSGFSCIDWQDENGSLTRQCATLCWLYVDERPNAPGSPQLPVDGECPVEVR